MLPLGADRLVGPSKGSAMPPDAGASSPELPRNAGRLAGSDENAPAAAEPRPEPAPFRKLLNEFDDEVTGGFINPP